LPGDVIYGAAPVVSPQRVKSGSKKLQDRGINRGSIPIMERGQCSPDVFVGQLIINEAKVSHHVQPEIGLAATSDYHVVCIFFDLATQGTQWGGTLGRVQSMQPGTD
jgi:hypothetical protein